MLTRPEPSKPRVPGSGTTTLLFPLAITAEPLKKPLPVLTVNWMVAPFIPPPLIAPCRVYACIPFAKVISVQVTGLLNEPLKITPFVPLILKLPPAAKVAPLASEPLVSAPVVKYTPPRLDPVMSPLPFNPLMAISVESVKDKPLLLPDSVPPEFAKSISFAQAAIGKTDAKNASKTNRFISALLNSKQCTLVTNRLLYALRPTVGFQKKTTENSLINTGAPI